MEKVRLGIIGIGNMGTIHANNVYGGSVTDMVLGAVCDIDQEKEKFCSEKYPGVPFFTDYKEMIKSGLVDLILIAVPHFLHPEMAIFGFENGMHVITEKPAGVYTKQVLEMNEAAKKSGKLFGINYCQRTRPMYQKIKKMVESGELGHIKRIQWTVTNWYRPQSYHDSGAWRSTWKDEGGGTLINQNPHQLDLWQWMFGMPSRLMAHMSFGKYYNIEVEDDVTAFMEYDNGTTGVYITSTGESPGTNRLEVACDMGRVIAENDRLFFDRNEISEREFNKISNKVFGGNPYWKSEFPFGSSGTYHIGILNDFANVLKNGGELLASGYEGINGLTISNAMHYSAFTGGWADVKNFPHDEFYKLLKERIDNSKPKQIQQNITSSLEGTYNG